MTAEKAASTPNRIPRFKTREVAAHFWDTHDLTEFEDQWRTARLKVAEKIQNVLSIDIEGGLLDRLINTSRDRGVGLNELATGLISEGLDRMGAEPAPAPRKKRKGG
jgi:hypothetical protein